MHDIHHNSMVGDGGGVGKFFGGGIGGGGGDRRLRAHQNQHQALKCPRCNSLNTKFCYYNNYNLSQPRHFCKSCRRYWTKGGVLRNVPVGGGCRKTKRSKPKHSSTAGKPTPDATDDAEGKSTASHSSSESSSLTASNSAVAASASVAVVRPGPASAAEVLSVPISDFSMNNPRLYGNAIEWPALVGQGSSDGGIFTEMGSFTSLISTPSNETTPFGFGGNTVNPNQQCLDHQKVDGERVNQQFNDQTVQGDGFGPLDWGGGGDHVLYDLTTTVDHTYWSQSQWTTDQDHHGLYLP